jgi:hypothetical protein
LAVQAYVNSVALTLTTGSKVITPAGLSFTPTGLVVAANHLTADGGALDARQCTGVATTTTLERYQAFESEDGSATADVGTIANTGGFATGLLDNDIVDFLLDFTSFDATPGFTFNQGNAPTAADILNYLLLGGDASIEGFVFNLGAASGNVSLATLSGQPVAVVFFTHLAALADTSGAAGGSAVSTLGWMLADGTQGVSGTRHTEAAAAGDTARWQRTDRCIDLRTVSANLVSATFVSMNANGFTVNATVTTSNIRTYGFAIYGGVWKCGAWNGSTSVTTESAVSTPGIDPKVLITQTWGRASDTATQVDGKRGWGVTDGTRRWALGYTDVDAADPTDAASYLDRTRGLVSIGYSGGAAVLEDAWDFAFGSQQFTPDHEVASGTTCEILYLVGGDAATGGASLTPTIGAAVLTGPVSTVIQDARLTPTRA